MTERFGDMYGTVQVWLKVLLTDRVLWIALVGYAIAAVLAVAIHVQ